MSVRGSEFSRAKAKSYREKLDYLRDYIEEGYSANVDKLAMDLNNSYRQMSKAFREEVSE